jgi:Mrp family chromosome partitioning ATPase
MAEQVANNHDSLGLLGGEREKTAARIQPADGGAAVNDHALQIAARLRLSLKPEERVIGFAGWSPEDGSSNAALETAAALAEMERAPILLVDGNARVPLLHKRFCLQLAPGLIDALSGSETSDIRISDTPYANLSLLTAGGQHGTEASGAFASKDCVILMNRLRDRFRYVVVNLGAWESGPEPMILASACQGIVITAARGKRRKPEVLSVQRDCAVTKTRVLGIVLTS